MTDVIFISVIVLLCNYGQQFFYLFYTKLELKLRHWQNVKFHSDLSKNVGWAIFSV